MDREQLRQRIMQLVREELEQLNAPKDTARGSTSRPLITADDVEAAARDSVRRLDARGAIVTPLARDRARELGVELDER